MGSLYDFFKPATVTINNPPIITGAAAFVASLAMLLKANNEGGVSGGFVAAGTTVFTLAAFVFAGVLNMACNHSGSPQEDSNDEDVESESNTSKSHSKT